MVWTDSSPFDYQDWFHGQPDCAVNYCRGAPSCNPCPDEMCGHLWSALYDSSAKQPNPVASWGWNDVAFKNMPAALKCDRFARQKFSSQKSILILVSISYFNIFSDKLQKWVKKTTKGSE